MFKFKLPFKKYLNKFSGVDIGTSGIRVVELSRFGKTLKLESYGELRTLFFEERPFMTLEKDALLLSDRDIATAVQTIMKEAGIKTKEVNFSIPDFCSFFTKFILPPMSEDELPQAIRYEARPYIPLSLSEITLDWSIIGGEVGKTPLEILVVAVPNEIVNQYQEIASLSNLTLRTLEPEVFALAKSSVKPDKKLVGLIDIGARSTTCSILENGVLKISHSFNIAGNELTEILTRSLKIKYNEAEEFKRKYGVVSLDKEAAGQDVRVKKIILPLIDSILEEIKKVFRDFYQTEGKEIERVVLAGGTALLSGLKEYFYLELKKEVVIADPFSDISFPPILKNVLREMSPSYAIAVGLALKGLE